MEALQECLHELELQLQRDQEALAHYTNARIDLIERLVHIRNKMKNIPLTQKELNALEVIVQTTSSYRGIMNGYVDATIEHSIHMELLKQDLSQELYGRHRVQPLQQQEPKKHTTWADVVKQGQ